MAKICIVLSSLNDVPLIQKLGKSVLLELRLDLLNISAPEIQNLMKISDQWMLSIRKELLVKPDYKPLITACLLNKPCYIDIDEDCLNDEIFSLINEFKIDEYQLIISYHNYEFTPDFEFLKNKINSFYKAGADIVKIACLGKHTKDLETIEKIHNTFPRIIAFLMGENYTQTRYNALLKGELISYACLRDENKTAPGQLTYDEMYDFLKTLNHE